MAKRLKTGIITIGLGILLGLNTPTFAKDTEKPEAKTVQEEQEPAFTQPVIKEYLTYETNTTQNDTTTIKMEISYVSAILLGNIPKLGGSSIILTGKKDKDTVKLEELGRYNPETKAYQIQKKNEISPIVQRLAEKILTEKAYKENSEPDALIYELFDALNTRIIKT